MFAVFKVNRTHMFILLFFVILSAFVGVHCFKKAILKWRYPVMYQEIVEMAAARHDLDPNLVYSIILVESKFNSRAVSKKNAKGLMQIIDSTGLECAKEIGVDLSTFDLYDPKINIDIGTYYMKKLLDKYSNLSIALMAYNSGIGNVAKWLKYSDSDDRLEFVPFSETKKYVKKVLKAYNMYNQIY